MPVILISYRELPKYTCNRIQVQESGTTDPDFSAQSKPRVTEGTGDDLNLRGGQSLINPTIHTAATMIADTKS